jgi:hypothetical protein
VAWIATGKVQKNCSHLPTTADLLKDMIFFALHPASVRRFRVTSIAFDPRSTSHWVFIRAWDGSGFYIEVDDPTSRERLMTHFQSVEEVEGASPPYEALFIRL